jgi:hypothetical protein
MSNLPRRNGIVRAVRRPQLGFLAFAGEPALGVLLKNQRNFAHSMTILRLSLVYNRDCVALISMETESASRFVAGASKFTERHKGEALDRLPPRRLKNICVKGEFSQVYE